MSLPQRVVLLITSAAQALSASVQAREFASQSGFAPAECDEIALAVLELASNLVRHAGGGELILTPLARAGRRGLEVASEDNGPGIGDFERAVADGFSTAGGRGMGLGAVNRLMDEMEFCPRERGLRIVCHRWVRPLERGRSATRLEFGSATRSYRHQPMNGDCVVVQRWENHALAAVIDGLGHGQFAQQAAQTARQYLEHHFDQPLPSLFRGAGRACRSTRGVVMAAARFELPRQRVALASVGNVEAWLVSDQQTSRPVVRRGIVGSSTAPGPVITEFDWTPSSLLILHSDGVHNAWSRDELSALTIQSPGEIARRLLETCGRLDDDATVLIARNAAPAESSNPGGNAPGQQ